MHVHPQGGEKYWAKFTGESCNCTPGSGRVIFLENWGEEIWKDLECGSG